MSAPHRVLGVSKAASRDDVKSAYRKLARETHPDRAPGNRLAARRWQELQDAYAHYRAAWAKEDAPQHGPAESGAPAPKDPRMAQAADQAKELARPFAAGMIGVLADFLKGTVSRLPGGVVGEIAGKAGQAAIDEAARKARGKLDDVLKRG